MLAYFCLHYSFEHWWIDVELTIISDLLYLYLKESKHYVQSVVVPGNDHINCEPTLSKELSTNLMFINAGHNSCALLAFNCL